MQENNAPPPPCQWTPHANGPAMPMPPPPSRKKKHGPPGYPLSRHFDLDCKTMVIATICLLLCSLVLRNPSTRSFGPHRLMSLSVAVGGGVPERQDIVRGFANLPPPFLKNCSVGGL